MNGSAVSGSEGRGGSSFGVRNELGVEPKPAACQSPMKLREVLDFEENVVSLV